jgi:hypothetical protein
MHNPQETPDKTGEFGYSRPSDDSEAPPVADSPPARIPNGDYLAQCVDYKVAKTFKGRRDIFIVFEISDGERAGETMFMACPYPKGKLRPRHKYYQQWTLAAGRHPRKKVPLEPKIFLNCEYRIKVRLSRRRHSDGTLMADCAQYSMVDTTIEPTTRGILP